MAVAASRPRRPISLSNQRRTRRQDGAIVAGCMPNGGFEAVRRLIPSTRMTVTGGASAFTGAITLSDMPTDDGWAEFDNTVTGPGRGVAAQRLRNMRGDGRAGRPRRAPETWWSGPPSRPLVTADQCARPENGRSRGVPDRSGGRGRSSAHGVWRSPDRRRCHLNETYGETYRETYAGRLSALPSVMVDERLPIRFKMRCKTAHQRRRETRRHQ